MEVRAQNRSRDGAPPARPSWDAILWFFVRPQRAEGELNEPSEITAIVAGPSLVACWRGAGRGRSRDCGVGRAPIPRQPTRRANPTAVKQSFGAVDALPNGINMTHAKHHENAV